jgi:hypothetical protein
MAPIYSRSGVGEATYVDNRLFKDEYILYIGFGLIGYSIVSMYKHKKVNKLPIRTASMYKHHIVNKLPIRTDFIQKQTLK